MNDITAIFAFLKYCLGSKEDMSGVIIGMDWQELYSFASKQAILGLCFEGIERLGKEYPEELKQNPIGRELLMTWMGKAQQIRRQNMKVNAVAGKLFSMLREDGLRCCILKGQGNALMYPNPYSRTPGDIDVWIDASRERIMEYAQKKFELGDDIRLQHLETSLDGVPVELHFFPCSMNNPIYHARLQKWFKRNADLQCSHIVGLPDGAGDIAIPTSAFNVIYQLTHLYHHFFDEGIGMRQIIDYFLVVNDFSKNVFLNNKSSKITPSLFTLKEGSTAFPKPLSPQGTGDVTAPSRCSEPLRSKDGGPSKVSPDCAGWDRRDAIGDIASDASVSSAFTTDSSATTALDVVQRELKYLGLWKFAGAVMYVLHETLGLSEEKMIAPMDEKRGKLLLAEILNGGNFGKHFTKYGHFTQQGMAKKYFLKIWRNMHFVRYYPAEALSEPIFRTWHFFWRMKNKK
ncbi:nucleotidyltransferase family protein [Segatella copri]|uniref:nucleotidyltransferase family protein n=1 Tax=Segatella copri TaxID=165179 RepID=UPI001C46FFD4|nr:nucleotidyltransferase family protein [Segatella copri]MBW0031471.1 nucleotidyltransferase family protein [Segatella copri]